MREEKSRKKRREEAGDTGVNTGHIGSDKCGDTRLKKQIEKGRDGWMRQGGM